LLTLPSFSARLVLGLSTWLLVASPAGAKPAPNGYTGKYTNGFDRYPNVSLVIEQTGTRVHGVVTIIGDSSNTRIESAEFNGRIAGGIVHFPWTDNYENAGNATFRTAGKGFVLDSRFTRMANDGRYFEGRFALTRVSSVVGRDDLPHL
jgi:hypothetical protein